MGIEVNMRIAGLLSVGITLFLKIFSITKGTVIKI